MTMTDMISISKSFEWDWKTFKKRNPNKSEALMQLIRKDNIKAGFKYDRSL